MEFLAINDLIKKITDSADSVEIIATIVVAGEHVHVISALGVRHIVRFSRSIVGVFIERRRTAHPRRKSVEFHPENSALTMTLYDDQPNGVKPIESVDDLTIL